MTPPATTFGLFAMAGNGHLFAPGDWLLGGAAVGLPAAVAAVRCDRPEERLYVGSVGAAAAAWTAAAWGISPTEPHLLGALAVGGTLAAIPWWIHMRVRSRVAVEGPTLQNLVQERGRREAALRALPLLWERWRRWLPAAAEFRTLREHWTWAAALPEIRLAGSEFVSAHFGDHVVTLRLRLRPGQTWETARSAAAAIESVWETSSHGTVTVEPGESTRWCLVRIIEDSPLDGPGLEWPATPAADFKEPIELGLFESDLSPVQVRLTEGHVLVAGATGSGKGGVLSLIMAHLAAMPNVRIWAGDPARVELSPWAAVCDRLEKTPAAIKAMLRDAMREVERRERLLDEHGRRNWSDELGWWIAIVVDELAQLDPEALGLAATLAMRCRKAGMRLIFATQRPSAKALQSRDANGTELRSQFDFRVILHVAEAGDVRVILGEGRTYWRAEQLPPKGWFFILGPGHDRPRRARAYRLSDEVVSATAERYALVRPRSDASPVEGEESTSRIGPSMPPPEEGGTDPRETASTAVSSDDDDEDPLALLREALRQAPLDGVRVDTLTRQLKGLRSDSWVYERIGEMRRAGEVVHTGRARYRLADIPRPSVVLEDT